MKKVCLLVLAVFAFSLHSYGQKDSIISVDLDDIEITLKSVELSAKGDTAIVSFFLHSYLKEPRELKLNTFASGVINPEGRVMFYDTIAMGNVKLNLADRQNYIHYLLHRNKPVLYVTKTPNWQKRWGKPQQFRITLEDHQEEGKFLQVDIPL